MMKEKIFYALLLYAKFRSMVYRDASYPGAALKERTNASHSSGEHG